MASNAGNDEIILLFGAREYKRRIGLALPRATIGRGLLMNE
jgi:hypothetical protein